MNTIEHDKIENNMIAGENSLNNTQQTFHCKWCKEDKTSEHFYMKKPENKKRSLNKCKSCLKKYYAEYSKTESYLISQRKFNYKRRNYDVTIDDYMTRLSKSNGKCEICGEEEQRRSKKHQRRFSLSLDHDHFSGKMRGLICNGCNKLLGSVNDNTDKLKSAILYLNKYKNNT